MAYTSEIDKLERRLKENPKGLTFAPLAEQYRKIGDHARALEVLAAGLGLHPNYVAGNIVLGRCHFDLRNYDESSNAFRKVLESDGENVIALQALADINEALKDFDASEHWLDQLLAIDAGNDHARRQRERLALLRDQQEHDNKNAIAEERLSGAQAAPENEPTVEDEPTVEITPVAAVQAAAEPPAEGLVPTAEPSGEAEPILSLIDDDDLADAAAEVPPEEAIAVSGLMPPGADAPDIIREEDPLDGPAASEVSFDVGVERHEEIVLRPSATSEFQAPSDAELLGGARTSGGFAPSFEEDAPAPAGARAESRDAEVEETIAPEELWQAHPEDATVADAAPPPEAVAEEPPRATPEPVAELEPETEPEPEPAAASAGMDLGQPMVTETMGDIYAAQGHHAQALEVYRQLLQRSPGDHRLGEKIADLEHRPAAAASTRGFAATETGGQSVRSYFGDLLSARLPESNGSPDAPPAIESPAEPATTGYMEEAFQADEEAPVAGEPTRPASGPLSLSAIFGEDSSPVPPVVAGPDTEEPKPTSHFDEFFGERPASPQPTTRARSARMETDQDDLEQFHKWLKGLKR